MKKWEYAMRSSFINGDASTLWNTKFVDDKGRTEYNIINDMGSEGWNLVSVTPIIYGNSIQTYTGELLFTFKREML